MKKNQPVSLEDIAKKLDVSTVTVSKALRNHPDISTETTEKVKAIAEKMGYMPNFNARNLTSRRSNTIGLIVPKIAHIFFATLIEAVYDIAFKNNYEIVLMVSQEDAEIENKHLLSLIAMRVDGIIISVTEDTKDLTTFKRIQNLGIPLLFVDRVLPLPGASKVVVDDKDGAFVAIDYAARRGYKKIAFLGGYPHINIANLRYQGFMEAMNYHKIPIKQKWIIEGGLGEEDGYEGFMKICKGGEVPEFVFAITYPVALGMYVAAMEKGLHVPQDIEVTCFGKNTFNRYIPSIFNFIDQPAGELASSAMELMMKQINNPRKFEPCEVTLKTQLLVHSPFAKVELGL